jgi:hypothetical protein
MEKMFETTNQMFFLAAMNVQAWVQHLKRHLT